jgi:hypothetical protein
MEVVFYYTGNFYLNIAVKFFIAGTLLYFYYVKIGGKALYSDHVFFTAFGFGFLGEIGFVYQKTEVLNSILVFLYLVEHQLYIVLLRQPNFQKKNMTNFDLLKKGWPYILTAFLFFGFFLMEIVPDSIFVLMIFYVFQFAILGAYSLMLNNSFEGKKIIIIGVGIMAVSDIISSWYVFLGDFKFGYPIIRTLYISSKFLLAYGFILNRKKIIADDANQWETEDI